METNFIVAKDDTEEQKNGEPELAVAAYCRPLPP